MPSTSKKQHNFMNAIAHNKAFAKKVGVPQSVGQEFSKADKGKTFRKGGTAMALKKLFRGKETYKEELAEGKAIKSGKITPQQYAKGEESEKVKKMAAGGRVKKMAFGGISGFGTNPTGGSGAMTPAYTPQIPQTPAVDPGYGGLYGGGNQGGAQGGLQNVYQGAGQVGQSLGQIQNALGGSSGGSMSPQNVGSSQTMYKKGGKVKKMAMGGAPIDPRAAAMAAKQASMAAPAIPMGAKRGMPMARPQAPQMAGMPQGKPMVGRMPPQANMPIPNMKKGGMTKMGAVKTKPGNINGVAQKGLTKGKVIKMAAGGSVGSASRRGDGIAVRGKTRA